MPRELVTVAPHTPGFREYAEPPLGDTQIRIRTEFAAPKHGTEMVSYRAGRTDRDARPDRRYDGEWGCFMPVPPSPGAEQTFRPAPLGNMAIGVVTEVGTAVTEFSVGDRVFGHLPIRETHTVEAGHVDLLPPGLTPQAAVCLDPWSWPCRCARAISGWVTTWLCSAWGLSVKWPCNWPALPAPIK